MSAALVRRARRVVERGEVEGGRVRASKTNPNGAPEDYRLLVGGFAAAVDAQRNDDDPVLGPPSQPAHLKRSPRGRAWPAFRRTQSAARRGRYLGG